MFFGRTNQQHSGPKASALWCVLFGYQVRTLAKAQSLLDSLNTIAKPEEGQLGG